MKNRSILNLFDQDLHEIARGTITALSLKIIGVGIAFILNIVLARTLGAENIGIYFLVLTIATIASVLGRIGLDNTVLRFIATYESVGDWITVKKIYKAAVYLSSVGLLLVMVLTILLAPWLAGMVFKEPMLLQPLRWMTLAIIPVGIFMLHTEFIKAIRCIRDSSLIQGVFHPAFSLLLIYPFVTAWGTTGAVWSYTIAALITMILATILWRKHTRHTKDINIEGSFSVSKLLYSSIPLFWIDIINLIMMWTAIIALGIWGNAMEVGTYSIASRVAMLISFILMAVNNVVAPKYAVLYKQRNNILLQEIVTKTTRAMIFIASPMLLVCLIFPEEIMLIFGDEFRDGSIALSVLAVGQFINVSTGSVGYLLIMCGKERIARNNNLFSAIVVILLSIMLVPQYKMLGAAIAVSTSLIIKNITAVFLVKKYLNIKIFDITGMLKKKGA